MPMDRLEYLDFELKFEKREQRYVVSVIRSPAGEAKGEFALPFSDLELENFLLKVGRTRRGVRRIGSPEWQAARAFGGKLFQAVCKGDVRGCFRSSLDKAALEDKGLRIKLRLLDAPELADLPWEYLYNRPLNRFLSLSAHTPIVRYIEMPEAISPLTVKPPLCILVMVSSPNDYPPLDVDREKVDLQEALSGLEKFGMVELEWLEEASLLALQRRLRRGRYHIFHFIGHGGFDERAQDGLLLMEDERGRGRRVSGQYLGVMLHDHRTLRLAVLNACEGARSSRTDPFAGTAMTLVQQGIPAVVAMQSEITDEAAIVFAGEFYAAIADGYPVDASLAEARKAIFATGNDVEWGKPVLYMRSPDGHIFDVESLTPEELASRRRAAEAARRRREEAERRALEQRRAQLASLYEQATARLAEQDWAGACKLLAQIQEIEPGYRDIDDLLNKAQAEQAQAEQVATLLIQGGERLERGKWAQAAEAYRQVLALVSDHPEAVARLAEAERQEQLTMLYTAAQRHLKVKRWSEAIEGFRAVLELEPTHEGAARQLAEAQAQLERQEAKERARHEEEARQAELARLYTMADESAQAEDWSKAIESFQAVLGLDASYRDAPTRLAQAREALAVEEAARQREAQLADLYEKATDRIQARDWTEAEQLLHEIRLVDPNYRDVSELLAQVASEREREERLATLYSGAEEQHRKGEWGQAVELYEQALALEPGYRDVEEKLVEAQRQQRLAERYAQALEHLQAQRWQEAIEGFRAVLEDDSTYRDAAVLLVKAKHQKELAGLPKPPAAKPAPSRKHKPTTLPK
jgi:outer membrane protein assembly factor BamD (BamD/ComL family)